MFAEGLFWKGPMNKDMTQLIKLWYPRNRNHLTNSILLFIYVFFLQFSIFFDKHPCNLSECLLSTIDEYITDKYVTYLTDMEQYP